MADNSAVIQATVVDAVGNAVDNQIYTGPNTALYFNGSNNMISLGDDGAFSITTTGALSVSAWINPSLFTYPVEEGTGYVHWLSKVDTNANEWVFRLYGQDNTDNPSRANRISFYVYSADGLPQGDGVAFQEPITLGSWMHIVGTIDAAKLMHIYKNGVQKDSATSGLTFTDTTTPVRVGSGAQNANPGNRSYFQGAIKDIIFWNRALTAGEANQVYSGSPPVSGMTARYMFNEGVGSTLFDSVGARTADKDGTVWVK